MFGKLSLLLIGLLIAPTAFAWTLKVTGHPHVGYELSYANSLWKLQAPGRGQQSWTPKPCADAIWVDFEKSVEAKIESLPMQWETKPPKLYAAYNVEYKAKKFFVSPESALGEFLKAMPDEVILTRTEEEIHCRRGAK